MNYDSDADHDTDDTLHVDAPPCRAPGPEGLVGLPRAAVKKLDRRGRHVKKLDRRGCHVKK